MLAAGCSRSDRRRRWRTSSSAPMLNGRVIDATWQQQPIGYFISERHGTGVSADGSARRGRARRRRRGRRVELRDGALRVPGHDVGAGRRHRRPDHDRLSRSPRSRSRARRHQLPDRHHHRRDRRGRHLLQHALRVFGGGRMASPAASISSRWRCTSSGICSALATPAIGETERTGNGGRRVHRHRAR